MTNMLETNEKIGKPQQRKRKFQQGYRKYKGELNWKFKTENTITKIQSSVDELNRRMKGMEGEKNQWTGS